MDKQTFSLEQDDTIRLRAHGNIVIQGWESAEIGIKASRHEVKVLREGGEVLVAAAGNCEIWLPAGRTLEIDRIGGRATLRDLTGPVHITRVSGDLNAENLDSLVLEKLGGGLAARNLNSLTVDKIGGDCAVEDITGRLALSKIGGDCLVKNAAEASVKKVGGDLNLKCLTLAESTAAGGDVSVGFDSAATDLSISGGGDLRLYLSGGLMVNLDMNSGSEDIRVQLPDHNVEIEEESNYSLRMGEGLPLLKLSAGGDVRVSDAEWTPNSRVTFDRDEIGIDWDFSSMGDSIARSVEAAVGSSARIADMGARMGEKAARRAEQRVERMMRRMNFEQRGETSWTPPRPPTPPMPPQPARGGISEEERMAVLQMLQEKKITLEEAEKLLDALDSFSE